MRKYLLLALLAVPSIVLAQDIKITSPTPGLGTDAWDFIKIIIQILTYFVVPAIAVLIIWAGFNMATAGGDPTKIKNSRNALLSAVIGAIVLFGAQMVVDLVKNTGDQLLK